MRTVDPKKYSKNYIPQTWVKIMWMLMLNYKYFYLQDLQLLTSAIVSLRNTWRAIFMHFLWNES